VTTGKIVRNWFVMRSARRLAAAVAATTVGGLLFAVPALAQSSSVGVTPIGIEQQAPTTKKPTATTAKRRTTATTVKRASTAGNSARRNAATTVAPTTVAPTTVPPTAPPVLTTAPLPVQSTSLTPVSVAPTTAPSINDNKATTLVNRVIFALIGLAVLVALLTFWYWRATKPVAPAIDGLDLMSTRKWLRGKPDKRARLLSEYHAKRGPVPEEVIARTSAPTVRVGAAVAAPVPAMAGVGESSLSGLASDPEPLDGPIVMVTEHDEDTGHAVGNVNGNGSRNGSAGNGVDGADGLAADVAGGAAPGGNVDDTPPPPSGSGATDPQAESAFTVVARRPRSEQAGDPATALPSVGSGEDDTPPQH
jgi:hypothetical protein